MSLFKILRGNEVNLPSEIIDGQVYFCKDTQNFYIDCIDTRYKINAKYADKLRYVDGTTVEIDPATILTDSNYATKIGVATADKDGLMSATDKVKLTSIAEGANKTIVDEVIDAESTNPVQNKVIKAALDEKAGLITASAAANGLMSAEDKSKLDGIPADIEKYTLPTASATVLGGVKVGANLSIDASGVLSATDTTYELVTPAEGDKGLMSGSDKIKLGGIAEGANKTIVDDAISDTSTNPVQNKVVKAYVDQEVASIVGGAPEQLDALNELAQALGNDENFAATMAAELGKKVDKVDGKQLSTNDYTTEEKEKLAGISVVTADKDGLMLATDKAKLDSVAQGAEVNVQADLFENETTSDAYVKNRIFGYYNETRTNVFPLTTLSKGEASRYGQYNLGFGYEHIEAQTVFIVIFDNIEYTCRVYGNSPFYLGGLEEYPFELIGSVTEPEYYSIIVADASIDHTLQIDRLEQAPVKLTSDWIESATPDKHASTHAAGGSDPISPASIGAAAETHAAQHGADGADPITPAMIGAATTAIVTGEANGLMIAADKTKLDGVATGAQVNVIEGVTSSSLTVGEIADKNVQIDIAWIEF